MYELFHYTSSESAKQIKRDECIQKTPTGYGRYGEGVYLTDLNPVENSKEDVARNNWGPNGYKGKLEAGKVDTYIRVWIPENHPCISQCPSEGRNVYLYKDTLYLHQFKHEIGRIDEWSVGQVLGVTAGFLGGAALLGAGLYFLSTIGQYRCRKCGETFNNDITLENHRRYC